MPGPSCPLRKTNARVPLASQVNLNRAAHWLTYLKYTSFWYYSLGLYSALALPTGADRAAYMGANGTLSRYSFSTWAWDGNAGYDVAVLLALAAAQRLAAFVVLKHTKKLQFK